MGSFAWRGGMWNLATLRVATRANKSMRLDLKTDILTRGGALAKNAKVHMRGPVIMRGRELPSDMADQKLLQSRTEDPWRVMRMQAEFVEGFSALRSITNAVSVFGSARTPQDSPYYQMAEEIGRLIAENGFATITGGGPGVMEAANKGAYQADGVSVGLGILVAFSQGPLQMNGTFFIVLAAHFVLISAFTFSNVTTGLARISADIENVASSLGASPWYRLRHVTLPLMTPWMISALALSLSLSMGELGATVMIYPPGWTTLPVTIFSLTDRGNIADGSALTIVLVGVTLLLMMKLERIARRLSQR